MKGLSLIKKVIFSFLMQSPIFAQLIVQPEFIHIGGTFTVKGSGFGYNEEIKLEAINQEKIATSTQNGTFSSEFTVLLTKGGKYQITAQSQSKLETGTIWIVPSIKASPNSGSFGDTIEVSGVGFGSFERIQVGLGKIHLIAEAFTNSIGTFSTTFILGSHSSGENRLFAIGHSTYLLAEASFFVIPVEEAPEICGISGTISYNGERKGDWLYVVAFDSPDFSNADSGIKIKNPNFPVNYKIKLFNPGTYYLAALMDVKDDYGVYRGDPGDPVGIYGSLSIAYSIDDEDPRFIGTPTPVNVGTSGFTSGIDFELTQELEVFPSTSTIGGRIYYYGTKTGRLWIGISKDPEFSEESSVEEIEIDDPAFPQPYKASLPVGAYYIVAIMDADNDYSFSYQDPIGIYGTLSYAISPLYILGTPTPAYSTTTSFTGNIDIVLTQELQEKDPWDPLDDTPENATLLIPEAAEQSHGPHTLNSKDLYDWYKINMSAGITYCFNTVGGSGDNYGELYSSPNANKSFLVAYDDQSGGNGQFLLIYTPQYSGYYYLRVRHYKEGNGWSGYLNYFSVASSSVNLSVSQWMSYPSYSYPGGTITFKIRCRNAGFGTASDVVFYDTFPDGLRYIGNTQGTPTFIASNTISLNIGTISPKVVLYFYITFLVEETCPIETGLINYASITSTSYDFWQRDNLASYMFFIYKPIDLWVTKRGPDEVESFSFATYTIMYGNNEKTEPGSVVIEEYLPPYFTYIWSSLGSPTFISLPYLSWEIGTLSPYEIRKFTILVKAQDVSMPLLTTNKIEIYTKDYGFIETNSKNNGSFWITKILPKPEIPKRLNSFEILVGTKTYANEEFDLIVIGRDAYQGIATETFIATLTDTTESIEPSTITLFSGIFKARARIKSSPNKGVSIITVSYGTITGTASIKVFLKSGSVIDKKTGIGIEFDKDDLLGNNVLVHILPGTITISPPENTLFIGGPYEIKLFDEDGKEFATKTGRLKKARLYFPFSDTNKDGFVDKTRIKIENLFIFHLDDGVWKRLTPFYDLENGIIWAEVFHFSPFALGGTATIISLKDSFAYPNPFILYKHRDYGITFTNLTTQAVIRIFNIKAEEVANFKKNDGKIDFIWKEPNLPSGVYIYCITNDKGQKAIGKIGIVK